MRQYQVAVLVGSLRQGSYNRKVAHILSKVAPQSLQLTMVSIGDLPFFNEDIEANPSASWLAFREHIRQADAILFVSPEYNRSMPAVLKNAIDVGSRPYGQSVWDGKPCGVVTVSVSALGGFGANHHLRQTLVYLNMPTLQQPEAYIGNAASLFDQQDNLVNDKTRPFLERYMAAFSQWVTLHNR